MKKILVLGSINIDQVIGVKNLPQIGETIHANSLNFHSGGKGANQAVAIAKMDCDVKLLSMIGDDEYGSFCLESCKNYNVNVQNVILAKNQKTGLASIYVQNDGINSIVILAGANNLITKEIIEENRDLIKECDILVTQLETNIEGVFYAIELAKKYNKITILNPAPAIELSDKQLMNVDYIIPNETELSSISGVEINSVEDIEKAFYLVLKKSPNTKIITTFGSKGVFYFDSLKNEFKNFPALKTNVVDTTAAGDSFIGGFVSQLALNKNVEEAINFGLKVAAITVSRKGAQDSIPSYKEVIENEKK